MSYLEEPIVQKKVNIESSSGQTYEISATTTNFDLNARIKRSSKALAIGLGLALASLPLPGLHFFLVPTFVLYSLYSAYSRFKETHHLNLNGIECPNCKSKLKEKDKYFHDLPLRIYCYECRSHLRIF